MYVQVAVSTYLADRTRLVHFFVNDTGRDEPTSEVSGDTRVYIC
jgi:hypothetical protein